MDAAIEDEKTLLDAMKKAFMSPITVMYMYGVFLIVWLLFAASTIKYWAQKAIVDQGLTGLEAFGYSHINTLVFFVSVVVVLALMSLGRE